jgi:membrane protein DedA with SNARE-associated domain
MSETCLNYLFIIALSGFIYLLILSFFAFSNSESLKIKKNKHTNSGIMLLINSIIYLAIAIYLNYKIRKAKKTTNY